MIYDPEIGKPVLAEICLLNQKQMKRHQEVATKDQGIPFVKAKDEEIESYLSTGSVQLVKITDIPKAARIIPMRFVCTWKENEEGIRIKAKARLVARSTSFNWLLLISLLKSISTSFNLALLIKAAITPPKL